MKTYVLFYILLRDLTLKLINIWLITFSSWSMFCWDFQHFRTNEIAAQISFICKQKRTVLSWKFLTIIFLFLIVSIRHVSNGTHLDLVTNRLNLKHIYYRCILTAVSTGLRVYKYRVFNRHYGCCLLHVLNYKL